ncbi:MAG TPA: YHS domain-containing (seleno)protein [Xanthobacteraceae bacterium]
MSVGFLAILGAAGVVLMVAAYPRSHAAEPVAHNRYTGLAIDGFDPVAYFTDGRARPGRPDLELRSGGASWRFANEGNMAAFAADPEVYAPRFGGYDPVAAVRGAATPGHPELWLIAENQLFLFYSEAARAAFARDPDATIEAAERHWPAVMRGIPR